MLDFTIDGDEEERRGFHFFHTKTAGEVQGFIYSDFWKRLILQASHADPAVLHATIALGAVHEMYEGGPETGSQGENAERQVFAIKQCNKAISYLNTPPPEGVPRSGEAVLLSCVLFICMEAYQGNHETALTHLENGLKILGSWLNDDDKPALDSNYISRPSRQFLEEELVPVFKRLDVMATNFVNSRSVRADLLSGFGIRAPIVPESFSSLTEANEMLAEIVHFMLHSNNKSHNMMYWMVDNPMVKLGLKPPPGEAIPKIPDIVMKKIRVIEKEHTAILEKWLSTMNIFLKERSSNLDAEALRGAIILKVLYLGTSVIIVPSLHNHDMEYDNYTAKFDQIVTLAESLLRSRPAATAPSYSIEMGLLAPLHYASCRCRDPVIRRRALSLLTDFPRREGLWDSTMLAAIGRWIIEEEEQGLGSYSSASAVPANARISILDKVTDMGERRCIVQYCKGVRNPYKKLEMMEKTITW